MRSKWIRCVLLVACLSLAAATAAPAAARPGEMAGLQPSWWQGAVAWMADHLPFVGWATAPSEDGEPAPPEGDGSTPGVDLLDPEGDRNESGTGDGGGGESEGETTNDWDPDG